MVERILDTQPAFFNRNRENSQQQPARKRHGKDQFEKFLEEAMKDGEDQKKREPKYLRRL